MINNRIKIIFTTVVLALIYSMATQAVSTVTANMDVTLTVESSCLLAVDPLNFGSHSIGAKEITGQTSATVTCTAGTPYILSSDKNHDYKMTNSSGASGTNSMEYTLYLDSAGTVPISQPVTGVEDVRNSSAIGNGNAQVLPIYGRLREDVLRGVGAGVYSDTVTLQLTY